MEEPPDALDPEGLQGSDADPGGAQQPQDTPRLGPAGAGADLQRLIDDLRAKGMSPRQIEALRSSWEAACHDPMGKGRGGPSLPENSPKGRVPLPDPPEPAAEPSRRPGLVELLRSTTQWLGQEQES